MILDADCLFEAKVENVERLAVSLGLRLPPQKGSRVTYSRKLVRMVLKHLEQERFSSRPRRSWGYSFDS